MLLFLINPGKQLNKARDSQRKEDFSQIRTALDTYYNDHNCYPLSLDFGEEWREGTTLYMKEIPQDANCGDNDALCYTYVVDPNASCPQWNVLFGRLAVASSPSSPACLLASDCLPQNYTESGYNLCNYGGNIDCSILQLVTLPKIDNNTGSNPTPTSSPLTPSPTGQPSSPTITPQPTYDPANGIYYCGCGNDHVTVCNVTYQYLQDGIPYYLDNACSNQCGQPC